MSAKTVEMSTSLDAPAMHYAQSMCERIKTMPGENPSYDENSAWNSQNPSDSTIDYYRPRVKEEPIDDTRNDSGVTSGSDCHSPSSDRSEGHPISLAANEKNMYHWSPQNNHQPSGDGQMQPERPQSNESISISPHGDENSNDFDEENIRMPKINSHGRVKVHKCKQCDFSSLTKLGFWEHSRVHIKSDKALNCPKCPFVTEYKHHLEYHLLNHAGAKPFKCPHCEYTCVNKSMLNSHLKSHSKVYQYRCSNCQYETKYCHSLKLHLRKYGHKPAMVLNPDGSPNPLPIIDVYGTRRGPKVKKLQEPNVSRHINTIGPIAEPQHQPQQVPSVPQLPFSSLVNPGMVPFPLLPLSGFPGTLPNPDMFFNIFREQMEELARAQKQISPPSEENPPLPANEVLDLSNKSNGSSEPADSDDEHMTTALDNVEASLDADMTLSAESVKDANKEVAPKNHKYDYDCNYCGISFSDEVLYRIHMGYHGYSNPFTCNMCGEQCDTKLSFFLHIARAAH